MFAHQVFWIEMRVTGHCKFPITTLRCDFTLLFARRRAGGFGAHTDWKEKRDTKPIQRFQIFYSTVSVHFFKFDYTEHIRNICGLCRGNKPCTSYSRTNGYVKLRINGYDIAYNFTHNNIMLEHNAMNNMNTIAHMNVHNTQY